MEAEINYEKAIRDYMDQKVLRALQNPKACQASIRYLVGKDKDDMTSIEEVSYCIHQNGFTELFDMDMGLLFSIPTEALISMEFVPYNKEGEN